MTGCVMGTKGSPGKNKHWSFGQAVASCSVCLEPVADGGDRSIAKLVCGHQFHLDCIGSAFNVKNIMQCPNCRNVENGEWLYANGSRQFDEHSGEDVLENLFNGSSQIVLNMGVTWYPYQTLFEEELLSTNHTMNSFPFPLSSRGMNQQPVSYLSHEDNISSPPHSCPYFQVHGFVDQPQLEEGLTSQSLRAGPSAAYSSERQIYATTQAPWDQRSMPAVSSVVTGMGFVDGRVLRSRGRTHHRRNDQVTSNSAHERSRLTSNPVPRANSHFSNSHYRTISPAQMAMHYAMTDEHGHTNWVYDNVHGAPAGGHEAGLRNSFVNAVQWTSGRIATFPAWTRRYI